MTKFFVRAAAVALALTAAAPAFAEDRLTGTLSATAVSEYFFRGISQTDSSPALQLGAEGAFKINDTFSGYLGLWGSNVDFNNGTSAEVDLLGGFRATFDKLTLDVGLIRYVYLNSQNNKNQDFSEAKLLASYDFGFVIPSAGIYYSPEYFNSSGNATYYTAGVTVPIPVTELQPKIVANIGRQNIDNNVRWGTEDYTDWNIGLFASYWGFTAGVQYVDNDIDTGNRVRNSSCNTGVCDAAAVFSLGYSYSF